MWVLSFDGQALLELSSGARFELTPLEHGNGPDRLWAVQASSSWSDEVIAFQGDFDSCLAEIRRLAFKHNAERLGQTIRAPEATF